MPLTQADIDELKRPYKEEHNEELSDREAWSMGHRLINLYRLLLAPERKGQATQPPTPTRRPSSRPSLNRIPR